MTKEEVRKTISDNTDINGQMKFSCFSDGVFCYEVNTYNDEKKVSKQVEPWHEVVELQFIPLEAENILDIEYIDNLLEIIDYSKYCNVTVCMADSRDFPKKPTPFKDLKITPSWQQQKGTNSGN